MRPCSLQRAASRRIAHALLSVVRLLDITKDCDRERLVNILTWLSQNESHCLTNSVVQAEVYRMLVQRLRCKHNPPVFLSCMLALCQNVIVDQVKMDTEFSNRCYPNPEYAGLVMSQQDSLCILDVIEGFQRQEAMVGVRGRGGREEGGRGGGGEGEKGRREEGGSMERGGEGSREEGRGEREKRGSGEEEREERGDENRAGRKKGNEQISKCYGTRYAPVSKQKDALERRGEEDVTERRREEDVAKKRGEEDVTERGGEEDVTERSRDGVRGSGEGRHLEGCLENGIESGRDYVPVSRGREEGGAGRGEYVHWKGGGDGEVKGKGNDEELKGSIEINMKRKRGSGNEEGEGKGNARDEEMVGKRKPGDGEMKGKRGAGGKEMEGKRGAGGKEMEGKRGGDKEMEGKKGGGGKEMEGEKEIGQKKTGERKPGDMEAEDELRATHKEAVGVEHLVPLKTKLLVLEAVYFLDADSLICLVQKMPDLHHVALQFNITAGVMRALSQHCPKLQSLCFLEQYLKLDIQNNEIVPLLFKTPPRITFINILEGLCKDKEFISNFAPLFPNLRMLDIGELYIDGDIYQVVYTLALLLQPRLEFLGRVRPTILTDIMTYRCVSRAINCDPQGSLPLKHTRFNEDVCLVFGKSQSHKTLHLFANLTCMELVLPSITDSDAVEGFINLFRDSNVKALSLACLRRFPMGDPSCLSYLHHLRLSENQYHFPFEIVHTILDHCPELQTLSIHSLLSDPHDHPQQEHPGGLIDDEERQVLDDIQALAALNDLAMLVMQDGFEGWMDEGARLEQDPPSPPRPPPSRRKAHPIHTKLTSLRIASLFKAQQQCTETFLHTLLRRVPGLQCLCLGPWLGSLMRQGLMCTATALVSVVTRAAHDGAPLLQHLEQLCCFPSMDLNPEETCQSLLSLVRVLPSLQHLTLPPLDPVLLAPTLRLFRHTHIDLRNKCDIERVWSSWDPEH